MNTTTKESPAMTTGSLEKQLAELTAVNKDLILEMRRLREEMSRVNTSSFDNAGRFEMISACASDAGSEFGDSSSIDEQVEEIVIQNDAKVFVFPYSSHIDMDKWLHKNSKEVKLDPHIFESLHLRNANN